MCKFAGGKALGAGMLGSGAEQEASAGRLRMKSMKLGAESGGPCALAPWGQGCARHVTRPRVCVLCLTLALRRRAGGVARFFNHSCDGGNMFAQTVLAKGDSALCYRVALFASKDIPAGTELTYDYKWDSHPDGRIECRAAGSLCPAAPVPASSAPATAHAAAATGVRRWSIEPGLVLQGLSISRHLALAYSNTACLFVFEVERLAVFLDNPAWLDVPEKSNSAPKQCTCTPSLSAYIALCGIAAVTRWQ